MLALTFISGCMLTIPSCTKSESTDTTANSGTETSPAVDASPIEIIKNNESMYTLVYPENCSDTLNSALASLVSGIKTATGVEVDSLADSKAIKENGKYILLGATCFDQSLSAIDSLTANEDAYTIKQFGDHIVITGNFDNATAAAVSYFTDSLIPANYDKATSTLIFEEYLNEGTSPLPASFSLNDIAGYTIVYSDETEGYLDAAQSIQERIKRDTEITLPIVKDTESDETPREILIGKTNRHLSSKCYKDGTRLMEYKLVLEKGQIQIVCGGPFSAKMAGYMFSNTVLKNANTTLEVGTNLEGDLATESIALNESADVRIMSANVLSEGAIKDFNQFPISAQRAEIFAKILVNYTPDIIGTQEMDPNYHEPMKKYFKIIKDTYGIEYSMTETAHNGAPLHSPIIYRSDKFKLDYQNFSPMSYLPDPYENEYSVGISSAKFTSLEDPTLEVALVTAHWHWEKEGVSEIPKQYYDAKEMAETVEYLRSTYPNAHVFCTGDFNSHRFERKYLNQLIEDIDGEIASDIAIAKGVFKASFKHQGQLIDHIIGKAGSFDVLLHSPTKNKSGNLTDHQPIFADIQFK